MRYVSFAHGRYRSFGLLRDGGIVDLGARLAPVVPDLPALLELRARGGEVPHFEDAPADFREDEVDFLPPVPRPGKILCIGLNYESHRIETGRPKEEYPTVFVRFPESIVGHRQPLRHPGVSEAYDYEAELAVVIGRPAFRVPRERAWEVVLGFSCFNDGSVRDFQRHTSQFTPGKNFVRSGAFGPAIVTRDEVGSLEGRVIRCELDGEEVQRATLDDLIFDVPALIAYITTWTELKPGDVIATGTPGGVGFVRKPPLFMKPGSRVVVEIEGVGRLENRVEAAD